jgi:hypothetical protein
MLSIHIFPQSRDQFSSSYINVNLSLCLTD